MGRHIPERTVWNRLAYWFYEIRNRGVIRYETFLRPNGCNIATVCFSSITCHCLITWIKGSCIWVRWGIKCFLYLRKYAKDAYLVPCFDNDLMWHTHQLHPVIYKADTQRIMGRFFNHDDTTNDRTEGTILWNGTVDTMKLWKEMFASEYNMSGAMFRGKESRGLYHEGFRC